MPIILKKIFLSFIALTFTGVIYAQDVPPPALPLAPHIRIERKEFKRERFAFREQKMEMRIRHDRRELRHVKNGMQHEWRHNRPHMPVRRGMPHRRGPLRRR